MQIAATLPEMPSLEVSTPVGAACFHCGSACPSRDFQSSERVFCCRGCQAVHELLLENGLGQFYELGAGSGARIETRPGPGAYAFLDQPGVREKFIDFSDGRLDRVSFRLPAIHCLACVWLLENLHRLHPAIGRSTVNFPRREAVIQFENSRITLGEVASLVAALGYEPDLRLADLDRRSAPVSRRLWLQLGVAGFAFGNTMLFSLPAYFGLDAYSGPAFRQLTGILGLVLALPVVAFSSLDYWRSAWRALRLRRMNIEVPIALGIAALFGQSVWEVLSRTGEGYFDSLAGLLFFLLCGRVFQQKTFDRLSFDRDYTAFFPLAVVRRNPVEGTEERVALSAIGLGDCLVLRNGELVPADSRLASDQATIDYSFVTGESDPVERKAGDLLHAGGRVVGNAVEAETVKAVSQSYLASLWDQEAFRKERFDTFETWTNRYSRRFTWIILGIGAAAALFWWGINPSLALKAFTSVLIVACPCALALAAPFALGTALRLLARHGIFVRNGEVLEALARINRVVFDKTGTLTVPGGGEVRFSGIPLHATEARRVFALAQESGHPLARAVAEHLSVAAASQVGELHEEPGLGLAGQVEGCRIRLGSVRWLQAGGVEVPEAASEGPGSTVHLSLDGVWRGCFQVTAALRPEVDRLIAKLSGRMRLGLLSGDNERDMARFRNLFGETVALHFHQSPQDKLERVRALQASGDRVMMVGDGLNDAGALRQADVGVAVVEKAGAFSPASDVIIAAAAVPSLADLSRFARGLVRVVRVSFLISTLYNVVGLSIAASGRLSPVVCAVLMPLSSVTVVAAACGLSAWAAWRAGLGRRPQAGGELEAARDPGWEARPA